MGERPVYLTPEGRTELEKELDFLRTAKRKEIADKINQSKELGTSVNNAEYDDAKREQSFVEGRIQELEVIIANAQVIVHETTPSGMVKIGSKVTVTTNDGQSEIFMLVGSAEAHPLTGRISNESPVGKALLGRRIGDNIQVMTPGGIVSYIIRGIE